MTKKRKPKAPAKVGRGKGGAKSEILRRAQDDRVSKVAPLSSRQETFCAIYAANNCATKAYREAYGASQKAAEANGCRLLRIDRVKARIAAIQLAGATGAAILSLREKREYLARVVRTAIGQVDEKSDLCQKVKTSITKKCSSRELVMPCKLRAIELDGKYSGELREQASLEVSGEIGIVIGPAQLAELQKRRLAALKAMGGRK